MEIRLVSARTKDLDTTARDLVIQVCIAAHNNPDFQNLFSYLPPEGLHVLAYSRKQLVSHAVVTTRWLQPEGMELLKTAYFEYALDHRMPARADLVMTGLLACVPRQHQMPSKKYIYMQPVKND